MFFEHRHNAYEMGNNVVKLFHLPNYFVRDCSQFGVTRSDALAYFLNTNPLHMHFAFSGGVTADRLVVDRTLERCSPAWK